ncbi:MAG: CapA family protein [Deltaproteobacteria bacterium]|nr:CapA family protein [Deltaproteobacteria bacterium]
MKLNKISIISFIVSLILITPNLVLSKSKEEISVMAVGDIMMGTDFPDKYKILPPDDGKDLFIHAQNLLKKGDLVFGNLEQVLIDGGKCAKNINAPNVWAFRCPVRFAGNLAKAHFNVMGIANNHAWDFGIEGIQSTMRALDAVKIKHSGSKGDIAKLTIKGAHVGLIAFSTNDNGHNLLHMKTAKGFISDLAKQTDILIVSFHGGTEGIKALHTRNKEEFLGKEPRGNVIRFSHMAIDSGADLVIGHGPHVPRAMELYKNKLIAYSLGNFCTYGIISIKKEKGFAPVLEVVLNKKGNFIKGKIYSFKQKYPGYPVLDKKNRAAKLVQTLSQTDFPENKITIDDRGNITRGL